MIVGNVKPKSFLIHSEDATLRGEIERAVYDHYGKALTFQTSNPREAMNKLSNAKPSGIITVIPEATALENDKLVTFVLESKMLKGIPLVILSPHDRGKLNFTSDQIIFFQEPYDLEKVFNAIDHYIAAVAANTLHPSVKKLKAGDILFREGDWGKEIFLVKSGALRVFQKTGNGEDVVDLAKIETHELVGEMAFVDDEPRSATVEALEDTELIGIPVQDFNSYVDAQMIWVKAVIKTLAGRLRSANARIRAIDKQKAA